MRSGVLMTMRKYELAILAIAVLPQAHAGASDLLAEISQDPLTQPVTRQETLWSSALLKKLFLLRPRSGLNENSPALQRWVVVEFDRKSVKRTTEKVDSKGLYLSRRQLVTMASEPPMNRWAIIIRRLCRLLLQTLRGSAAPEREWWDVRNEEWAVSSGSQYHLR